MINYKKEVGPPKFWRIWRQNSIPNHPNSDPFKPNFRVSKLGFVDLKSTVGSPKRLGISSFYMGSSENGGRPIVMNFHGLWYLIIVFMNMGHLEGITPVSDNPRGNWGAFLSVCGARPWVTHKLAAVFTGRSLSGRCGFMMALRRWPDGINDEGWPFWSAGWSHNFGYISLYIQSLYIGYISTSQNISISIKYSCPLFSCPWCNHPKSSQIHIDRRT